MISESTTIKVNKETKMRLDNFKEHKAESYEELIKKILYLLNVVRKNPEAAKKILSSIDQNVTRKNAINKEFKQTSESQLNPQEQKETH
jgi:SPX domain protein involved in polyphosphate accumulation